MKRSKIKSTSIIAILIIGLMSCQEVDLTFDQSNAFIAFTDGSGSIAENATETLVFDIYYASTSVGVVSVNLNFDVTGIDNPAVEGVDFRVISSKTLNFNFDLVQEVEIEVIDNDLRDQDKSVNIVLMGGDGVTLGMGGGKNASYLLTILDNEHPLANWIGTYEVAADSYGDVLSGQADGAWNEEWVVTTSPVEGDETKLSCVGIGYGDLPVTLTLDLQSMTITLPAGADVGGSGYNYDETLIWLGDYENVEEADVVGTLHEDGSISVDLLTMIVADVDGIYIWDSFNTSWTRASKKAANVGVPLIDKIAK